MRFLQRERLRRVIGHALAAAHVKVYNSGNLTSTTATWLLLTYDTEVDDTDGFHSTVTNTGRLTVPTGMGGVYVITVTVEFAANATGRRQAIIQLNGSPGAGTGTTIGQDARKPVDQGDAQQTRICVAITERLADGDFVTANVYQDSGGNLAVNGGRQFAFSMVRVGD